jgi:hypothetical protein
VKFLKLSVSLHSAFSAFTINLAPFAYTPDTKMKYDFIVVGGMFLLNLYFAIAKFPATFLSFHLHLLYHSNINIY